MLIGASGACLLPLSRAHSPSCQGCPPSGQTTLAVEAKGRLGDPASTLVSSRIEALAGEIRGRPLRIEQPGEVRLAPDRLSVGGLRLVIGESRLTVDGSVGAAATAASSVEATLSGRMEDLRALWTDTEASWAGTVQAKRRALTAQVSSLDGPP